MTEEQLQNVLFLQIIHDQSTRMSYYSIIYWIRWFDGIHFSPNIKTG